jgi:hypothetical protein
MVRRGRGARSNLAQRMIIAPGSPDSEIIGEFDETETGGSHQLPEFNPDEEEESRVVEERHPVEDKEMLKTGRPASMEWILLSPTFYAIRQSLLDYTVQALCVKPSQDLFEAAVVVEVVYPVR